MSPFTGRDWGGCDLLTRLGIRYLRNDFAPAQFHASDTFLARRFDRRDIGIRI
jgi:hypothetical protein